MQLQGVHLPTFHCVLMAQYVCWAELAYIQLLTPRASFLGHLGGILAGACAALNLTIACISMGCDQCPRYTWQTGPQQHMTPQLPLQGCCTCTSWRAAFPCRAA